MDHVLRKHNPYLFFQLSRALHQLSSLSSDGGSVLELFHPLFAARNAIQPFIDVPGALPPSSRRVAVTILEAIDSFAIEKHGDGFAVMNKLISSAQIARVQKTISDFEIVLANEIQSLEVFIVADKGIYSTTSLIENAEQAIRCTLLDEVQQAVPPIVYKDFNQAGRCLAFEVPTAAGFHAARAVEAMVKAYWATVMEKDFSLSPMMSNCINELKKAKEDTKVLDILDHVRDLHRNAIMHPETFLTMSEALRLFDIAKSAISAIAERMYEISRSRI